MIRRPPRSTLDRSSAASDVYKRQVVDRLDVVLGPERCGGGGDEAADGVEEAGDFQGVVCLLYTSPSPRDRTRSRMPSSA